MLSLDEGNSSVYVTINFIIHKKYLDIFLQMEVIAFKEHFFSLRFLIHILGFTASTSLSSSEPQEQWLSAFTNVVTL